MSAGTILSVRDLSKTFRAGPFRKGFRALDGVTLTVERGSVFGLLGPNGAGKTTLIKVLLGLVPRWKGEATILGRPAGDTRVRARIGFLPEAHRLPPHLTGRQMLLLYGLYAGRDRRFLRERIPHWLERLDMLDAADRRIGEYSKGMQQRVGLAQALIHEPELVFLDEPTDGVDPVGRRAVREIVSELHGKGVTVFINSHLLMEVERMCDRVVIMSRGKILREGSVEELTERTGRVFFELSPKPSDLNAILQGSGRDVVEQEKGFEITLGEEEQNRLVDRLRERGISIRSIQPRRLTLEEAFIDLVQSEGS